MRHHKLILSSDKTFLSIQFDGPRVTDLKNKNTDRCIKVCISKRTGITHCFWNLAIDIKVRGVHSLPVAKKIYEQTFFTW